MLCVFWQQENLEEFWAANFHIRPKLMRRFEKISPHNILRIYIYTVFGDLRQSFSTFVITKENIMGHESV